MHSTIRSDVFMHGASGLIHVQPWCLLEVQRKLYITDPLRCYDIIVFRISVLTQYQPLNGIS
jgi:hypothetical protein